MSNKIDEIDQSQKLTKLIDTINHNNLSIYYPQSSNSLFKQYIDELNLNFYIETEKILSKKSLGSSIVQSQDKLFIILIQQISLYIKEIERLNQILFNTNKDSFINKAPIANANNQGYTSSNVNLCFNSNFKAGVNPHEQNIASSLTNGNKKDNHQLKSNEKENKCEVNETNFSSLSSNENNNNNYQRKGSEHNDINLSLSSSAFTQPKKKRTLSGTNPYPTYNKNIMIAPIPSTATAIKVLDIKENNKSPYINRTHKKITNFKIIKNVKLKMKSEEENSKIHSPTSRSKNVNANINMINCNRNQSNTSTNNKNSLINEMIIYETQLKDLSHIENMLLELKQSIGQRNKIQLPKLTSIVLDTNHDYNNGSDTPHFRKIPSFICADILIEGKNGQ